MPFRITTKATIVYKAVRQCDDHSVVIAVLKLPPKTTYYELSEKMKKESWSNPRDDRKCRAEHARVMHFLNPTIKRKLSLKQAQSDWDFDFKYPLGKMVRPTRPFAKAHKQCASGIHFFFDYKDAKSWL